MTRHARNTAYLEYAKGVDAPAKSYNGVTLDTSKWSASMVKSFSIKAKVKFNNMNSNYPHLFWGEDSGTFAFCVHGLGPAYGGRKGETAYYLATAKGIGPHGRGLDNGQGWIGTGNKMDDGQWHDFEVAKYGTKSAIFLDGHKVEASIAAGKTEADFIMKPVTTLRIGTAKEGTGFEGDIGDVVITAEGKQVFPEPPPPTAKAAAAGAGAGCTGSLLPGNTSCDEQSVEDCKGKYTELSPGVYSHCDVSGGQCLATGPICKTGCRGKRRVKRDYELPAWLKWLEGSSKHLRVRMREWEDGLWRKSSGWHGHDLIHSPQSAVYIPCYFYSPAEKMLQGPVCFGPGAESHRGLCHGGAMTSAAASGEKNDHGDPAFDDLLGHLAFLAAGEGPWSGATVQINCKLCKPVRVGQTLLLEGHVAKQERKKVFVEARLVGETGEVYGRMDGLSIVGAKMQEEDSELDRRQWHFDEAKRAIVDSPDHRHLL
ncbi:unnamed protein product [Effrenium voratum]|uniref:Thioesterase domain-containing protein n=1 Tax=Effrenium voratum TaxID=2562239 RepID=A0AA36I537_9DINO|nr:unnamed protein product [Effrenium voratum]